MLRVCIAFVLILVGPVAMAEPSGPIRVIDGDTIVVGKIKVRLHGIDAPELGQTCTDARGTDWDCGTWVARQVRARWEGLHARCETRDKDRYGRSVAVCFIGGDDIGQVLVRDGLALAYRKYSMAYDLDEKSAVIAARGLHGHVMQSPAEFRGSASEGSASDGSSCTVKGNISRDGTRIYHVPGQEFYSRTRISPSKGERWFCSELEARRAGWRKARN